MAMKRRALIIVPLAVMWLTAFLSAQDAAPRWQLIFLERFRFETWDNAVSLDDTAADSSAYTRNRMTLGLRWAPARNLEVLGKVTNEFRVYLAPKDRAFNIHELIADNLYVKWTLPGRLPLTITAGRQDMTFGEGFVIADGTPLDGSRSYYFNALRVDADLEPGHRLTVFLHGTDTTEKFLPVINDRGQALAEQPERALAAYYSGSFGKVQAAGYLIRKCTNATDLWPLAARIDTFGGRVEVPVAGRLALTAEGALQWGKNGEAGRSAFGGLFHFDYDLAKILPVLRTATLGGVLLSGDNPETDKMEGWDPLFSRWPKWSDSLVYTFGRESRSSYWSNFTSLYGSLALDLGSRADGLLKVQRLGALEPQPGLFPGGAGRSRGTLLQGRLNYTISRHLSGRMIWEHFLPGDFYFPGASRFHWLQFEMIFRL
jgi:hypothetical protein